jgi:O-antigen/teichoic acid export membrane protein
MFWRGVLGYLPVQALDALVGVGAVVVFTRLLTAEQYGQYALAFSAAAIVQTLFLVWAEAAMERFHIAAVEAGRDRDHLATVHRAYALLAMGAGVFALVLLTIVRLNPALELALAAGIASVVVHSGFKLIQHRRRAEGRVAAYALNDMACTSVCFASGVALAAAGWGGAAPLVGAAVGGAACFALSLPGELDRARGGRFEAERARRYAAYGVPVALSLILATLLSSTDRILIAAFLDEASVGAYHAGYSVAHRTLDVLFIWIGLAGGPALVAALERGGPPAMAKAARLQGDAMMLVGLPAAVGLAMVARPLADVVMGEGVREGAARIMPWIAVSGLLAGITAYHFNRAFTLSQRSGLLLASMAVPALANLALNLVLIPRFGLQGAVWATVASFGLGAAVAYALGRRVMPMPLPVEAFVRCAVAAAAMAAALALLPRWGGLAELALKVPLGAATYAVALLLMELVAPGRGAALVREWRGFRRAARRPALAE